MKRFPRTVCLNINCYYVTRCISLKHHKVTFGVSMICKAVLVTWWDVLCWYERARVRERSLLYTLIPPRWLGRFPPARGPSSYHTDSILQIILVWFSGLLYTLWGDTQQTSDLLWYDMIWLERGKVSPVYIVYGVLCTLKDLCTLCNVRGQLTVFCVLCTVRGHSCV